MTSFHFALGKNAMNPCARTSSAATFMIVPIAAFFMAVTPVTLATAGEAEFSDSVRLYETERRSVAQFYELSWSSVRQQRMDKLYA